MHTLSFSLISVRTSAAVAAAAFFCSAASKRSSTIRSASVSAARSSGPSRSTEADEDAEGKEEDEDEDEDEDEEAEAEAEEADEAGEEAEEAGAAAADEAAGAAVDDAAAVKAPRNSGSSSNAAANSGAARRALNARPNCEVCVDRNTFLRGSLSLDMARRQRAVQTCATARVGPGETTNGNLKFRPTYPSERFASQTAVRSELSTALLTHTCSL